MPRANRYWVKGAAYHLTHRCHNREFLLKRVKDRDAYRELLRRHLLDASVSLLNYTITSNHVHLLITTESHADIALLMQRVQGQYAERYNRVHGRQGAFWSDRYHATQIDGGSHLWACLTYIDLNMVRAGVVQHPRDWPWTGWHELTGEKRRNRLLDRTALLNRLDSQNAAAFEHAYRAAIEERVTHSNGRDPRWTESIAVGRRDFVERAETQLLAEHTRSRTTRTEAADGAWILKETSPDQAYGGDFTSV